MATVVIKSSYSAQPSSSKPNPFVESTIQYIIKNSLLQKVPRLIWVADQGCGKLRHLPVLEKHFQKLVLVETVEQLTRKQTIFDRDQTTLREYFSAVNRNSKNIRLIPANVFSKTKLGLDLVFNICVMDVEVLVSRKAMIRAVARNLRRRGLFVVIVPRNDQTILVRCTQENRHCDGHVFHHHGVATFYRNFRDPSDLVNIGLESGLSLLADLSIYRQVCLIFRK